MTLFRQRLHQIFPISISFSTRQTFIIFQLFLYLTHANLTETSKGAELEHDVNPSFNDETSKSLLNKLQVTLKYNDPKKLILCADLTRHSAVNSKYPIRRTQTPGNGPTFSLDLWGFGVHEAGSTVLDVVLTLKTRTKNSSFKIKTSIDLQKLLMEKMVKVQVKGKGKESRFNKSHKFTVILTTSTFDGQVFFLEGLRGTQELLSKFIDSPVKGEVRDNPSPTSEDDPYWFLTVDDMQGRKLFSSGSPPSWTPLQLCYPNDLTSEDKKPEKVLTLKVQQPSGEMINVTIRSGDIFPEKPMLPELKDLLKAIPRIYHEESPPDTLPFVTFKTIVTIGHSMYHHIMADGIRPQVYVYDYSTQNRDNHNWAVRERIKQMSTALQHISSMMYYERNKEPVVACEYSEEISQMFDAPIYYKLKRGKQSICKVLSPKSVQKLFDNQLNVFIHIFALDTVSSLSQAERQITKLNASGSIVIICTSSSKTLNLSLEARFPGTDMVIYDTDGTDKHSFEQIIDQSLGHIPMAISEFVKKIQESVSSR